MKRLIPLIIALFIGCSFYRPIKANKVLPGWMGVDMECKTIGVTVIPKDPYICCPLLVNKYMGSGDPRELYRQAIINTFTRYISKETSCREVVFIKDSVATIQTTLPIKKKKEIRIRVPRGSLSYLKERGIDYLLILQDYSVHVIDEYNHPDGIYLDKGKVKVDNSTDQSMVIDQSIVNSVKYLFVDCATTNYVQYGDYKMRIQASDMDKDDWEQGIEEMPRKIIKQGPFYQK